MLSADVCECARTEKRCCLHVQKREEFTRRSESNAYKVSKISVIQVNRRKKKSSKTKKKVKGE